MIGESVVCSQAAQSGVRGHRVLTNVMLRLAAVGFAAIMGIFFWTDPTVSGIKRADSTPGDKRFGNVMDLRPELNSTGWPFPFPEADWEQTPPAVQAYLHTLRHEMGQLQDQVESLQARLNQDSTNSSRPPSSDSPYQKPRRRTGASPRPRKGEVLRPQVAHLEDASPRPRKGGGKPGHPGHRQVLLALTSVEDLLPEVCACGSGEFGLMSPYYTHQVIELPRIEMEVSHWVLHQGRV